MTEKGENDQMSAENIDKNGCSQRDSAEHDGITHIKKVFSGDERMMMQQEYYRQNHYKTMDAFKGSISLFLEIPFFIGAYQFLSRLKALQGVSFGPLSNLGAPDGLLVIGSVAINLLPILMTAVNMVSCVIYTKGFPKKTKIQLYIMSAVNASYINNSVNTLKEKTAEETNANPTLRLSQTGKNVVVIMLDRAVGPMY